MNLKELLAKKAKGEELTEEELKVIAEFEEMLAEEKAKIELAEKEKELANTKFAKADTELQEKLKELSTIQEMLEKEKNEKDSILNLLETQKNSSGVKEEIARLKAEQEFEEQKKKLAEEKAKEEQKAKEEIEKVKSQLAELQKQNELFKFKQEINSLIVARPYLKKELEVISKNAEEKGIDYSNTILQFLLETKNHEDEMKAYEAKRKAGESVFTEVKKEVKKEPIKEKDEKYGTINMELAKKYGFIKKIN